MSPLTIISFLAAAASGGLAMAALLQRRHSRVHWFLAAGLLLLAAEAVLNALSTHAVGATAVAEWQRWRLAAMSLVPGVWLGFSLFYSRGNPAKKRHALLIVLACLVPAALTVALRPGLIKAAVLEIPAFEWTVELGWSAVALHLIFLLLAVGVLMNLEGTFRAAVGTMRWRIKFVVLGLGILFTARIYTCSQVILYTGLSLPLLWVDLIGLLLACALIGTALFRSGLVGVDVYPSRAVLQRSLTVVMAGAYLVAVGLLAKLVTGLGGENVFPFKAFLVLVACLSLAIVMCSERFRLRTKTFISRHFRRPHYDYRQAWREFTQRTASLVEEGTLCRALVQWLAETMQVSSATIWLVDNQGRGLVFAASTALPLNKAHELATLEVDLPELRAALGEKPEPIDLDTHQATWAEALKLRNPGYFKTGGHWVCSSLFAGGELIGLITVGDRVSGVPFSTEDLELLKCASDQAASCLQNIRLSQRLVQAKELEAFQTMSAFFVHDLKNTASTLSLTLENFKLHFQNPAFREDALRAIGKSLDRIKALIGSLGVLRQKLELSIAYTDLNDVVRSALKPLNTSGGVAVEEDLSPVPLVAMDRDKIKGVVTNLVLNAREAVQNNGQIRVETVRQNGWVMLSVQDDGCGMSSEFLHSSLFRPFQTTKKNGLGIGMFHCRTIVEAHRGKIEVTSQPGKGTTFRVLLPIQT